MKYHKAHLTRRLILDMCQDHELEEQTIIMLKVIIDFLKRVIVFHDLFSLHFYSGYWYATRIHK